MAGALQIGVYCVNTWPRNIYVELYKLTYVITFILAAHVDLITFKLPNL